MPAIHLETDEGADQMNGAKCDKNWQRLAQQILSPFPTNRTIIKYHLSKKYNMKFVHDTSNLRSEGFFIKCWG